MKPRTYTPDPRHGWQFIRATASFLFLFLCTGLSTALAVDFCVNPGFEDGTGNAAPPWSFWGGTGGAVANPFVGTANPSPRVWSNFGNPTYVNVASQNNMNLILDTTGTVTYHVHAMYYVPSSEIVSNAIPRAAIRFSCDTPPGTTYAAGAPFLLDDASDTATIAPDGWVTFDFDWSSTSGCGHLNYMSFRLYGHDPDTNARRDNPGGYFDNCQMSSDAYRNDIHGVVKDNLGVGVPGATVALNNAYALIETKTTAADGSYAFTTMVPYGDYTVNASKFTYTPNSTPLTLSAASASAPDITLTKAGGLVHIRGTVTQGGAGVNGVPVTATSTTGGASGETVTSTIGGVAGSYSIEVPADTYKVTATLLPLAAPAQELAVSSDVTLDFALESVLVVGVYADGLTAGPLTTWTNKGTLGGEFEVLGTNPPVAGSQGQFKAVYFNNNPMALGSAGTLLTTPAAITGPNANYTVCAWLFEPDPVLPDQQTYISWAKRGGPDGSNCEMVYGVDGTWGAAGHWGAPDLPWGTPPTGGTWHNVIVTWDSAAGVEADYIDGVFSAQETKTLAIAPDLPIVLGSGYWWDGTTISPDIPFSGYIAQVEIFGVPATAEEAARLASLNPPMLPIATLKGKVVTTDGSAKSGYTITVTDNAGAVQASATTGADGTYSCAVAAPGSYTVKAIKSGYVTMPAPQTRTVAVGETATFADFTATLSTISGILKDSVTGKPINNGVVQTGDATGPAVVTEADGAFTLPAVGCGGVEVYADAVNYAGRLLLVTGTGSVHKNIALTAGPEPASYSGDMEDLVNPQPAQWIPTWGAPWGPWGATGTIDWSASTNAKTGKQSLFYTPTDTPEEYAGILKAINLVPDHSYNFYFRAKADPEVARWQPLVEFSDASNNNWDGFVSADPAYYEYAHMPPYQWHTYLLWFDRASTRNGPAVRWTPLANQTECHFIFLYEGSDANTGVNPDGTPSRLPLAGEGCYIDDLVLDAVPNNLAVETVSPDLIPPPPFPLTGFSMSGGVPSFRVPTTLSYQYRLVYANEVTDAVWTPIGTWTPGTGTEITLSDSSAVGQAHRFYRLQVQ